MSIDLTSLLVGFTGLLVYLASVTLAAARPPRYRYLSQAMPYALIGAFVGLTNKHGLLDSLGCFVVLSGCTWLVIWGVRKQWQAH